MCNNANFTKKETTAFMSYTRCLLITPTCFRSPSATILRVQSIKEYNENCVWRVSARSNFIKYYNIMKF
jgi:hypothetical protein